MHPDALEEILNKITFSDDELCFVHPDRMDEVINRLAGRGGIKACSTGVSRAGRNIYSLTVGMGQARIFATAGAHANEPTGTVTLLHLAGEIAKLQGEGYLTEYQFIFIPQLDPDGAALNWEWMKAPYSYKNYLRHMYRQNDPDMDIENGIAVVEGQEMRPEVMAFRKYIDRCAPVDYYISFHSTHELGGALFMLGSPVTDVYDSIMAFLTAKCRGAGLEMLDADLYGLCGISRVAPGFLTNSSIEDVQSLYLHDPQMLRCCRMTTIEYARRKCGARFSLTSELPFIVDSELNNQEETEFSLCEYQLETLRRAGNALKRATELWNELAGFPFTEKGVFWRAHYEHMFDRAPRDLEARFRDLERYRARPAKMHHLYSLHLGRFKEECDLTLMALRRLEGLDTEEARRARSAWEQQFEKSFAEYEKRMSFRILTIPEQVRLQAAMTLAGLQKPGTAY